MFIAIGIYTIFFSFITVSRYYSFRTYAYDLGNYNQILHTTLFDGKLLYSSADLIANPSGSLFGIHFSPIFFVILPIYAVYPHPPTLLALQSFVIALGALPVYLIASKRLKNEKWGLLFASLYLLNPALQGVNWYDFHPDAFLPTLFLFSIYFLDAKKIGLYLMSFIFTLMTLEFASIVFVFVSAYFIIKMKPWKRSALDSTRMKLVIFTLIFSLVWFFVSLQIIHAFNPQVRPVTGDTYWREVGATSLLDIPEQVISHPTRAIQALSFDGWQKLSFVLIMLGSVAFLPLIEPLIFVCLPWIAIAVMSNFQPFYQLGDQYPAFIIPFLFYAAIIGMERLKFSTRRLFSKKKVLAIMGILFGVSILIFFFCTPLNSRPYQSASWISYGLPEITKHDRDVLKLLELIPQNASIMTQNNIFPLVSGRLEAYLFPSGVFYPPGESFGKVLYSMLDKVDFIVGDLVTDNIVLPTLLHYASINGSFGLYAAADGAIILKRGYSDTPVLFQPVRYTFNYNSLFLVDGSTVKDPESKSGYAFLHSTANKAADLFWVGPYVFLPPGDYEATFRIKTDNASEAGLIDLYVSCFLYKISINYIGTNTTGHHSRFKIYTEGDQKVLASRRLNASDFNELNKYQEFAVKYTVSDFGAYEFRGTALSNSSNVFFDEVRIIQIQPSMNLDLEVREAFP